MCQGLSIEDKDAVAVAPLITVCDNPVIRKRARVDLAIKDIRNEVPFTFIEHLGAKGFKTFESSRLIGAAPNGGAKVFQRAYFGKKAHLEQSPAAAE